MTECPRVLSAWGLCLLPKACSMLHQTEVPCPVTLDRISRGQARGTVTATPDQCAALAQRLRIHAVTRFHFRYEITRAPWPGIYRLHGQLWAELDQQCVVTLEAFPDQVTESFSCLCGTEAALTALEASGALDPDEDPPEVIHPEQGLEVGELVIQYLALALVDYPRRPDADLPHILHQIGHTQQDNHTDDRQNPFKTLDALLKK
jgi:Large ribosomal RNA subunit accumulation protein YceD